MTSAKAALGKEISKIGRPPELTSRDWEILALLGEYGCVTASRIKDHFWNANPNSRAHYRRLAILQRRLLIENVLGDRSMTIGYRLTKQGKEALGKLQSAKPRPNIRRFYKTQFEHDQLLIDIRRILSESPLIHDFKTEAEIRNRIMAGSLKLLHWESAPLIPDAIFCLEVSAAKVIVGVELELTPKSRRRYTRIFRGHLLAKDWQMVIYIVKDAKFRDQLMKTLSDIKNTDVHVRMASKLNGIYFCTLEEFLSRRLDAPLTNGKRVISLAQMAINFSAKA